MAAQRFLNNFDWAFLGPVTAATHVGFESTIGRGILQISDAASALLLNPTGGDWYVLTGYKRAGSVESAIEIIKVLGVNEVAYAAPGECRIRVERGHEGSALQTYVAGDLISMRITADGLNNLASDAELTAHTGNVSNPHTVTKAQVGLGNADNTSDANKPVSTAQAAADTAATNAAKAYADGLVLGLWDDRGNFNASVNTYPATGGSGAAGAILKGDIWTISVVATAGPLLGNAVGTTVRAVVDTPAQVAGNWAVSATGLGYVPENTANKNALDGYPGLVNYRVAIKDDATGSWFAFLGFTGTSNESFDLPVDGGVLLTNAAFISPPAIGNGTPAAGTFTTVTGKQTSAGAAVYPSVLRNSDDTLNGTGVGQNFGAHTSAVTGRIANIRDAAGLYSLRLSTFINGSALAEILKLNGTGGVDILNGALLVTNAAGIGYGIGAGGTVAQATSKSTAVTLSKPTGQITMHNAALAAGATVFFTVSNTLTGSNPVAIVGVFDGTTDYTKYHIWIADVGATSFRVFVKNTSAGSLSDALILRFAILNSATS